MISRLKQLASQQERLVVGLNIGTSLDGIDAVLLAIQGCGDDLRFRQLAFHTYPLLESLRQKLADPETLSLDEICQIDGLVAQEMARATEALCQGAGGLQPDMVASHGVTLYHRPPKREGEKGTTMQLGNLQALAAKLNCLVVGDFRNGDMAAGGQGAPLMPFLDYLLFRDKPGTLVVNLGGIANITYVGESVETVKAFDTGPANMPLDQLAKMLTKGKSNYDEGGAMAAMGRVEPILLEKLLAHPFILAAPPKSTGREQFGRPWLDEILKHHQHMKLVDILATLTCLSAQALHLNCREWIEPLPILRVLVSGGGVHNLSLMNQLKRLFDPVPVASILEHAVDPDAKEAILFAILGNERLMGRPNNLPSATGAFWPVSMGTLC